MNTNLTFQWVTILAFSMLWYAIHLENKRIVKLEENQKFLISYVKELQNTNNSQFKKQIKEGSK